MSDATWGDLPGITLLSEPTRAALYRYVADRTESVGRDEAARAVGITRTLAAFHLDRLAQAGLLDIEYARLTGRTGPGAGRPAKLYRCSPRSFHMAVPARDYELPARLLADVTASSPGARRKAETRARSAGMALGVDAARAAGRSRTAARLRAALVKQLKERGFEPRQDGDGLVRLRNCPFDALAREQTSLMCGMNHALLQGLVEGLGLPGMNVLLEPAPGRCCVTLRW